MPSGVLNRMGAQLQRVAVRVPAGVKIDGQLKGPLELGPALLAAVAGQSTLGWWSYPKGHYRVDRGGSAAPRNLSSRGQPRCRSIRFWIGLGRMVSLDILHFAYVGGSYLNRVITLSHNCAALAINLNSNSDVSACNADIDEHAVI